MPPKKATKAAKEKAQADTPFDVTAIPPSLPPSVEEAYRRKCIQLKQRTNEVEEENDATRIRCARIRRQIEKMRVERAFLLEQLTRRTSTNVDDSDGSPSPPPTPQEKPLRTKRGHRKPSMLAEIDAAAKAGSAATQAPATMSPSSEAFSLTQTDPTSKKTAAASGTANGVLKAPKRPPTAFDLYCDETRPTLVKNREEQDDEAETGVEEELARCWTDLPEAEKEVFQQLHDKAMARFHEEKKKYDAAKSREGEKASSPGPKAEADKSTDAADETMKDVEGEPEADNEVDKPSEEAEGKDKNKEKPDSGTTASTTAAAPETAPETQDEDVEMTNYDTEEQAEETSSEKKKTEE